MTKATDISLPRYLDSAAGDASFYGPKLSLKDLSGGSCRVKWSSGSTDLSGTFTVQLSWESDPDESTDSDWEESGESFSANPAGTGAGSGFLILRGLYAPWARLKFARSAGSADSTTDAGFYRGRGG